MSESWNLPEREITPQKAVLSRRRWLAAAGLGTLGLGTAGGATWWYWFRAGSDQDVLTGSQTAAPGADLYPVARNADFAAVDRPLSSEAECARYTNFYEFSGLKNVWNHIAQFQATPWNIEVAGLVARPRKYDIDELVRAFPLEERVYRHRCVEAWAMVVPWTGFPLAAVIKSAEPLPAARFVRFVSFHNPEQARGQRNTSQPWPYNEGLTLAEATNELAFIATGMYGHPLLKQHGAPVRVVVPWKYGFKSAKSIVRIELTERQPPTFWNTMSPHEYDFAANVNPDVPHPRWSQRTERMLGTNEIRPTQLYNGYGEWVRHLYV
jgi:sulfoxide reductase catalytic subunit YedY